MNRRRFLATAAGVLVAPAVVRAESIMRVRRPIALPSATPFTVDWYDDVSATSAGYSNLFRPEYDSLRRSLLALGEDLTRLIRATAINGLYDELVRADPSFGSAIAMQRRMLAGGPQFRSRVMGRSGDEIYPHAWGGLTSK